MPSDLGALRATLDKCGQQHLLEGYEALAPEQQAELLEQLQVVWVREGGGGHTWRQLPSGRGPHLERCRQNLHPSSLNRTTLSITAAPPNQAIDYEYVNHIFKASMAAADTPAAPAAPVTDVATLKSATAEQRAAWRADGLAMLGAGKLGLLLLAGGQGTRLGRCAGGLVGEGA